MNAKVSSLLFFALTLFFTSANTAIDITQILSSNPDFSQFSTFLTQTKIAEQINSRQTITVLVVDNGAMSSIAEKPQDVLKKILSVHVVLDYYDMEKVTKVSLTNRSGPSLTTLFQASGQALNQQGFLTVFLLNEGEVTFGSSVQGAPMNSMLVKSVSNQPNIISVLQISQPIEVPGIETPNPNAPKDNNAKSEAPQQASASAPTQAQSPSRKIGAPTPGTDEKAQTQPSKNAAAASAPTQEESATAPASNKDSAAPPPNQKNSAADAPTPTQEDSPAAAPSDSRAETPSESPVESPTPAAATVATSTPVNAQASPAEAPSSDSAPSQKAVAIGFGVLMSLVSFLGLRS